VNSTKPTLGFCMAIGVALLGVRPVLAADPAEAPEAAPASDTLEEVVVTAEKRVESVQTVPIAITVLPSEELERQGAQTIVDLSRMSSALEFTAPAAAPGGGAFIRGIGTESVGGLTATGSVSVVLDGVVLGNANITDIFDINRIEILKGPQGTLFGSSVSAGVISVTTNAPKLNSASASLSAEYGSGDLGSKYQRKSLRATANLPLNSISALRFSFHSDDNSGVFYNPYENLSSDQPDIGARVRYLLQPTDALSINLIADYNRAYENGVPVLTYRSAPPGSALAGALASCGVTASSSNFDTCSQYYNVRQQLDRGVSAQVDWTVAGNTLTSITSYRLADTGSRGDIQAIPLAISEKAFALGAPCLFFNCVPIFQILPGGTNSLQTQKRSQYTEELRLASPANKHLEWVAGLYFQHYKLADNEPGLITANFGFGEFTAPTDFHANVSSEDYAAFGNLTYYIADATRLIGGARFTHSRISESKFDPANSHTQNTYSLSTSAQKVSWRAGVQHDFSAATMAYLTVSTGYKAPEISDNLANGGQLYAVKPEVPTNYELGIKQSLLDNRLAFDADIFYEKVKDYQGQACAPNNQGTITCVPTNVSAVNTKGVELDIFGKPVHGLTVNLSATYNPATYPAGYLGSDGSNQGGLQLNYASKTKVTLSAEDTLPLSSVYSLVIGAEYTYRSKQSQFTSGLPEFVTPATNIFGARIGLSSSANWSLYLFGRNLTNEHFTRQLYPTPFQPGGLWQVLDANSKRLVGLQFQAQF
jgi:iron complex outermembrane recepter protein